MYLAKIRLMTTYPINRYAWHQKLWECFPDVEEKSRKELGFLTRIDAQDGAVWGWVLSKTLEPRRPDWCAYEPDFHCKSIPASFLQYDAYHFDIMCNPTRVLTTEIKGQKHKKRIPILKSEELREWFLRKASEHGFNLLGTALDINQHGGQAFEKEKNKSQKGVHNVVQFKGKLNVTHRDVFIKTYHEGIGSAKGFGFGLLLLKPIQH